MKNGMPIFYLYFKKSKPQKRQRCLYLNSVAFLVYFFVCLICTAQVIALFITLRQNLIRFCHRQSIKIRAPHIDGAHKLQYFTNHGYAKTLTLKLNGISKAVCGGNGNVFKVVGVLGAFYETVRSHHLIDEFVSFKQIFRGKNFKQYGSIFKSGR